MASASDIRAGGAFVELYLKGGHLVEQGLDRVANKTRAFAMSLSTVASISNITYGHSATAIRTSLTTIANTVNKVSKGIQTSVKATEKVLTTTLNAIPKAIDKTGKAMSSLGTKTLFGGMLAGGVGVQSMSVFMEYERQMARVKALTGATGAVFQDMTDIVRELGRTTQYTTAQAAEGMAYLAMAGLKARDAIDVLPVVLDLATAAQMDLGLTADIVTDIGLAFGYTGRATQKVADILAMTATNSNTTVEKMGTSFKYLASVANTAKYPLEDMATALALLAQVGIKANTAGTNLREAIINMVTPAKRRKIEDILGVRIADARGEFRPFFDIVDDLERSLNRFSGTKQVELMSQIFGKRGGNAMLSLIGQGRAARREKQDVIWDNDGATKQMADTMRDSLWGSWKAFVSAIQDTQIGFGEAMVKPIRVILDSITDVIRASGKWINENKDLIVQVGLMIPPLLAAGAATLALGKALSTVATIMTPVVGAVTAGISAMSMAIVGATSLTGIFTTAIMVLASTVQTTAAIMQSLAGMLSIAAIATAGMVGTVAMLMKLAAGLGSIMKSVFTTVAEMWNLGVKMFATTADVAVDTAKAVSKVGNVVASTATIVTEFTKSGAEFTSTVAGMGSVAASSVRTISNMTESVSAVPVIVSKASGTVIDFVKGMSAVSVVAGNVGVTLASTTETVTGFVNSTGHAFQALTRFANGAATTATVGSSFAASFVNVSETVTNTGVTLAKTTTIFSRLADTLAKVKSTVVSVTSSFAELAAEKLKAAGTMILTIISGIGKALLSLGTALLPLILAGAMLWSAWSLLKAVIAGVIKAVQGLAVAFFEMAKNVASALGTTLLGSLTAIGTALGKIFSGMQKYFNDSKPAIDAWRKSVTSAFEQMYATYKKVVKALQAGEVELAMNMIKREAFNQLIDLEQFARNLLVHIISELPKVMTWFGSILTEMFQGIGESFIDFWTYFQQEFRIIMAEVKVIALQFMGIIAESGFLGKAGTNALRNMMKAISDVALPHIKGENNPEVREAQKQARAIRYEVTEERVRAFLAKHQPDDIDKFESGKKIHENIVVPLRVEVNDLFEKMKAIQNKHVWSDEDRRNHSILKRQYQKKDAELIEIRKNEDYKLFINLMDNELPKIDQLADFTNKLQAAISQALEALKKSIAEGNILSAKLAFASIQNELKKALENNDAETLKLFETHFGVKPEELANLLKENDELAKKRAELIEQGVKLQDIPDEFNKNKLWELVQGIDNLTDVLKSFQNDLNKKDGNTVDRIQREKEAEKLQGKSETEVAAEKRKGEIEKELDRMYRLGIGGEAREKLHKELDEQNRIIDEYRRGRKGMTRHGQHAVEKADFFQKRADEIKKLQEENPDKYSEEDVNRSQTLADFAKKFHEGKGSFADKEDQRRFDELLADFYVQNTRGGMHRESAEAMAEIARRNSRAECLQDEIAKRKAEQEKLRQEFLEWEKANPLRNGERIHAEEREKAGPAEQERGEQPDVSERRKRAEELEKAEQDKQEAQKRLLEAGAQIDRERESGIWTRDYSELEQAQDEYNQAAERWRTLQEAEKGAREKRNELMKEWAGQDRSTPMRDVWAESDAQRNEALNSFLHAYQYHAAEYQKWENARQQRSIVENEYLAEMQKADAARAALIEADKEWEKHALIGAFDPYRAAGIRIREHEVNALNQRDRAATEVDVADAMEQRAKERMENARAEEEKAYQDYQNFLFDILKPHEENYLYNTDGLFDDERMTEEREAWMREAEKIQGEFIDLHTAYEQAAEEHRIREAEMFAAEDERTRLFREFQFAAQRYFPTEGEKELQQAFEDIREAEKRLEEIDPNYKRKHDTATRIQAVKEQIEEIIGTDESEYQFRFRQSRNEALKQLFEEIESYEQELKQIENEERRGVLAPQAEPAERREPAELTERDRIVAGMNEAKREAAMMESELKKLGGAQMQLSRYGLDPVSLDRIFNATFGGGSFSAYDIMRGGIERDPQLDEMKIQTGLLEDILDNVNTQD